jgi:hypothetical protein
MREMKKRCVLSIVLGTLIFEMGRIQIRIKQSDPDPNQLGKQVRICIKMKSMILIRIKRVWTRKIAVTR